MKITAIYGTNHVGSTVTLARMLLDALTKQGHTCTEFFLPRDFDHFCSGCGACFAAERPICQQAAASLARIEDAITDADIIVLASPVYVYHVTGAMKNFLDHFGCRWIIHRPNGAMTGKTAVLLTTAAGSGLRRTLRDLKDSMNWWGVGRVYACGMRSRALRAADLTEASKVKMRQRMEKLSRRLTAAPSAPRLGVRLRYWLGRKMGGGLTAADHAYWQQQGWSRGGAPWKSPRG